MSAIDTKREREKKTVALMIRLYCRKKHGVKSGLCPDCKALSQYAEQRSDKCPFMESKTFCSNCKVHCYKPDMREKIREVMRFSGPRMIMYHPIMAVRHVVESKKEKTKIGEREMKIKKIALIVVGCIGVGLGAVGAVVPMLPAFPFLMLAAVCFAKSSEKLDRWFKSTKLYKNNLESFVKGQGMTWKTKIKVMITVTVLMSIGFLIMFSKAIYIPCIILGCVWIFHIVYFCFGVKTYKINENQAK